MTRGGLVRGAVLAAILLAILAGAWPLYNQVLADRIVSAAREVATGGDLERSRRWERLCLGRCPVTALVAAGGARAALAIRARGGDRVALLAQAQTLLTQATRVEPLNGEAWIQLAYVQGLQDLGPSPRVQATLRQGYKVQPFSQAGGLWRVRLCGGYWPLMAPDLQAAAIQEARWRWSIHADERPLILAALPNPQARLALRNRIAALPLRSY